MAFRERGMPVVQKREVEVGGPEPNDKQLAVPKKWLKLKQNKDWNSRIQYYEHLDWTDPDAAKDPYWWIRFSYYHRRNWQDQEALYDQDHFVREGYHKCHGWDNQHAKTDVYPSIRVGYYQSVDWTDVSWYDDPAPMVVLKGIAEVKQWKSDDNDLRLLKRLCDVEGSLASYGPAIERMVTQLPAKFLLMIAFGAIRNDTVRAIVERVTTNFSKEYGGNDKAIQTEGDCVSGMSRADASQPRGKEVQMQGQPEGGRPELPVT
jgi:hypothetical protein